MSARTEIPLASHDGAGLELSPAWSCDCEENPIRAIAVSPPGVFAVVTDNNVSLYGGAPSFVSSHALSLAPARLTAHAFSSNGKHLVTGDSDGYVKWWEVHTGVDTVSTLFPWSREEDHPFISVIVASPNSNFIAAAAGDSVCIYGEDGQSLHTISPLDSRIRCMEWKDANELAVNIGTAICMIHVTADCFSLRQKYPNELQEGELMTLACSANMFAAGCAEKRLVQIWDLASENNKEISVHVKGLPTEGIEHIESLEWDSTGRFLAVRSGSDVVIWDMHNVSGQEDNSIMCFGHKQKAKITALSFQPNGSFLATGGDDAQVLVFDSKRFTSTGVVGNLVGCLVSAKLKHSDPATAITALAWHPSGFVLAGTSTGHVDAFEVPGAIRETPRIVNEHTVDTPFLFKKTNANRRPQATTTKPSGWGGEPLHHTRNEEGVAKGFTRRRNSNMGPLTGGQRSPGGKPKVYLGHFRRPSSEGSYPEIGRGSWAPAPAPAPNPAPIGRWPTPHQQITAPYASPTTTPTPPPPYPEPLANPPHTPESSIPGGVGMVKSGVVMHLGNGSEGGHRGPPPVQASHPQMRRNDRLQNRTMPMEHPIPAMMPGAPSPYPGAYMQYPAPFPMGFMPPPYCYPYQMHPGMSVEGMPTVMPGYGPQPYFRAPPSHPAPKVLHLACDDNFERELKIQAPPPQGAGPGKVDVGRKDVSSELEEELGSKSSEATNNGVNNNITPTLHSDTSTYHYDMHAQQGQTLYVGNLAMGVEESILAQCFTAFGPITGVQVIRDRETHLSRGFGFVTFVHPCSAQAAMEQLDSAQLHGPFEGRKLRVSFSNRR